jgi:hypothetical protein
MRLIKKACTLALIFYSCVSNAAHSTLCDHGFIGWGFTISKLDCEMSVEASRPIDDFRTYEIFQIQNKEKSAILFIYAGNAPKLLNSQASGWSSKTVPVSNKFKSKAWVKITNDKKQSKELIIYLKKSDAPFYLHVSYIGLDIENAKLADIMIESIRETSKKR